MSKITTTGMRSRGQVVIPMSIRIKLNLEDGNKFIVIGDKDTIVLKKIKLPNIKEIRGKYV